MNILKVCVTCSILGIMAIAMFMPKGPTAYAIANLSDDGIGRSVSVEGTVDSVYTSKQGHTFITISDGNNSISVVAFKGTDAKAAKEGSKLRVTGKLATYKQELEIIADSIMTT